MKKLIFLLACVCLITSAHSQSVTALPDGFYLVADIINDSITEVAPGNRKALVHFNTLFLDYAPEHVSRLTVYTDNFVPLELDQAPELLPQTDAKKMVELSFSRLAADQLSTFTSQNIMKEATLVVNGEALTLHKIRAAITGGKMQITRCDDNACEHIYTQLKNNVKK